MASLETKVQSKEWDWERTTVRNVIKYMYIYVICFGVLQHVLKKVLESHVEKREGNKKIFKY